jgi:predicted secreted protein
MSYPTAGVGGQLLLSSNVVSNVDVWQLQQKALTKDTTSFGAPGSWQQNTTTIKNWNAKVQGRADPSDTNGQLALMNGLGSTFTTKFYVDGTHYWSGTAILTDIAPKTNANDVVTVEYSFMGTGACTLT